MTARLSHHLGELEARFSLLEPKLKEGPEKEAISILHALILENRQASAGAPADKELSSAFERVANLYKTAPGMAGPAQNQGLPTGARAPGFSLPDANGRRISLSDYAGQVVVLIFYPLDWSPACSDQLSLYQSELDEFARLNASLLAVSVDSLYSHGAWAAVRGISFPLLSDFQPHGEVARLYQVYRPGDGFSERALYIIDPAGVIRYRHVAPRLPEIPDIYDLFSALKAIQTDHTAQRAGEK